MFSDVSSAYNRRGTYECIPLSGNRQRYLTGLGYDTSPMRFVTAVIHTYAQPGDDIVRAAQQTVMDGMPNGDWFDTDDLSLLDQWHFNRAGIDEIGNRFVSTYSSIPEPSTVILLASTSLVMLFRRRRRSGS